MSEVRDTPEVRSRVTGTDDGAGSAGVDWRALLERALTGDGVSTHFQPIVDLGRGRIVGYEALTRFHGYPIGDPTRWFEAARALHCSAQLEALALRTALTAREDLPADTFLAVNVGPDVLTRHEVQRVWSHAGDLDGVVIELTEHARIDSYLSLEPALNRLRASGALIAIDDAGAGYAGLQHLIGIRPHVIKLDRQLVSGIDRDETKRALVEMIGTFASRIDAWVLAEGIEHLGELETVLGLGVPLGQGYLLGRPGPPWVDVDRSGAALIRRSVRPHVPDSLRTIVERATVVADQSDAISAFGDPTVDLVVLLDPDQHPVAVMDVDGSLHSALDPGMRIDVGTGITEAAERAVTRPVAQRFRPLVCVDEAGRYVGVVRMERVLTFLSGRSSGPSSVAHPGPAAGPSSGAGTTPGQIGPVGPAAPPGQAAGPAA